MKGSSTRTITMLMGSIHLKMAMSTKVNGSMASSKGMEYLRGQMETNTMVLTKMARSMGLVPSIRMDRSSK